MIFRQPVNHLLKRDNPGSREYARLAHTAAQLLADTVRALDEVSGAADNRANRRAQTFAQAERDRVSRLHQHVGGGVQSGSGIENARAVDMQVHLMTLRKLRHVRGVFGSQR